MSQQIVVIGAGAAGCLAAIEIKKKSPTAEVTVLERGRHPLAKVAITGGGRCNVTNSFEHVKSLEQVYPRGHRLMKKLFHQFSHVNAFRWFEDEGVRLVTQDDGCVFPRSQNAMEIVSCMLGLMRQNGVRILTNARVDDIRPSAEGYDVIAGGARYHADKVLVTTGGHPGTSGYKMLRHLSVEIVPSQPSLFSFCLSDERIKILMGTVVKNAQVSLVGTKLKAQGPLLITHWGISGPAVLKLSSYAARLLAEQNYIADVSIRWITLDQEGIVGMINDMAVSHRDKKLASAYPEEFNARLWIHILTRASLSADKRWKELSPKDFNRLINIIINDTYHITAKNRFKDEFVTSGGVALSSLDAHTLEAKKHRGLYFAGEVTDVDAITGGFNLQAAWTMGYVAAQAICRD